MIPILIVIPVYSAVEIVKLTDSPAENGGFWTLNDFGQCTPFKVYAIVTLLLENVIPVVTLIVLNTITLLKFKRMIWTVLADNRLTNLDASRFSDFNYRYTKLITALTFICIVTRLFDSYVDITNRMRLFCRLVLSDELDALVLFVRAIAFLQLFTVHSLDGILYFVYDKKLKNLFQENFLGAITTSAILLAIGLVSYLTYINLQIKEFH